MLYYDEVFQSIQGESTSAGLPCVFVRLFGCNVGCSYCDQPQKKEQKKRISVDKLINKILSYHIPRVCITGGEPLLQQEIYPVVYDLVKRGYDVSIETSGCVPIDNDGYVRKHKYIMDVKCPSSKVSHKNIFDNLAKLHLIDEVKYVIKDRADYDFARDIMRKYPTNAKVLFSPVMELDENGTWKCAVSKDLVKWVLEDGLTNVRIQVQLHKFLEVQ
jgi:7-carboxy-7-deazaguanine synthase